MNTRPAGSPRARRRWPRRLLLASGLLLAALATLWLLVALLLPPERVVPLLLSRIGASLNLEISAEGDPASQLGERPSFVVRNLVAREPGAARPLLQARRVSVALPWHTIRSLGDTLDLARVELDAPVLDLPALQHWLSSRPSGAGRLPTLSDGLRLRNGRIEGGSWRIDALDLTLPQLQPSRPLRARASGRYVDDTAMQAPFQLAATLMRPVSGRGFGLAGTVAPAAGAWRLPTWITLSGALHWDGGLRLLPAHLGSSGRFVSGATRLPFSLGLHGPLRAHDGAWTLVPAGLALRGGGLVPTLDARGRLALGQRLLLDLHGRIAHWPDDWPALPPPLGASREPLALSLDYLGPLDFTAPLALRASRSDALRFDGELHLPALLDWANAVGPQTPLPPLRGRLEASRLEISGAQLEGVTVDFEDDGAPEETAAP